jgi:ABC-type multidrug transport system fused ATPase/permease subunit
LYAAGGIIMKKGRHYFRIAIFAVFIVKLSSLGALSAQTNWNPSEKRSETRVQYAPANEPELDSMREQLFKLLRMSPRLTMAISMDPLLLRNQEYVSQNNPQLAAFLETHTEVMRNPEFYLFAKLPNGRRQDVPYLFQRSVWPEIGRDNGEGSSHDLVVAIFFISFSLMILWLLRMLLQNRRWSRIFKVQTEIHNKLLDKLAGSQELLSYLGTEAGKKFMEMTPINAAMVSSQSQGFLSPITRILAPLQFGVVSAMAGIGMLFIKGYYNDKGALLLLATLALMLGLGLIISAGISWILARRLGLISKLKQESLSSISDAN